MSPELPDEDVTLIAHAPDRRRRSTTLIATACSCCCCCCIHSIGGIAGAIYGGFRGHLPPTAGLAAEEAAREQFERTEADRYAFRIYWLALAIIAIITFFVALFESGGGSTRNAIGIAFFAIALGLPFGQLGASVLAVIYINVFPPARKSECLRRLGRITLFAFLWGLIGFGVMVPFAFLFK